MPKLHPSSRTLHNKSPQKGKKNRLVLYFLLLAIAWSIVTIAGTANMLPDVTEHDFDEPSSSNRQTSSALGEREREREISRARTVLLPQNSTKPEEVEEFLSKTSAFRAQRKIDEERLAAVETKKKKQISFLEKQEVGWSFTPPEWMHDLCPDVVAHYNRFPSFKEREPRKLRNLPFFPTNDVAQAVSSFCQQQLQLRSRIELASLTSFIVVLC